MIETFSTKAGREKPLLILEIGQLLKSCDSNCLMETVIVRDENVNSPSHWWRLRFSVGQQSEANLELIFGGNILGYDSKT